MTSTGISASATGVSRATIAASIDVPPAALDLVPDLFKGLNALGSSPRRIAGWLRAANIGANARAIDLGCGKGAVAIATARFTGCRVEGIDGFAPFIEEARERARRAGVAKLCRFRVGDVRAAALCVRRRYDAVLLISVTPLEVGLRLASGLLKPGGVLVLDDAVLVGGRAADDTLPDRATARACFARAGFTIEREHVSTRSESSAREAALARVIRANARSVLEAAKTAPARQQARIARLVARILRQQQNAADALIGPLRPAVWLARWG